MNTNFFEVRFQIADRAEFSDAQPLRPFEGLRMMRDGIEFRPGCGSPDHSPKTETNSRCVLTLVHSRFKTSPKAVTALASCGWVMVNGGVKLMTLACSPSGRKI